MNQVCGSLSQIRPGKDAGHPMLSPLGRPKRGHWFNIFEVVIAMSLDSVIMVASARRECPGCVLDGKCSSREHP